MEETFDDLFDILSFARKKGYINLEEINDLLPPDLQIQRQSNIYASFSNLKELA